MLEEIYNKLAPGGSYICISHGTPEARMQFLNIHEWTYGDM